MLGQHTGDVIVYHHHFVHLAVPLPREDADGGGAASHAHALLFDAVDQGCLAGFHDELSAAFDRKLDRLAVAQVHHELARDAALFLAAAGEMVHAAEREHLRAVFSGGDVPHRFAATAHGRLLGTEPAVGVDLHFEAAVAEDAFGHDRDHVHACVHG